MSGAHRWLAMAKHGIRGRVGIVIVGWGETSACLAGCHLSHPVCLSGQPDPHNRHSDSAKKTTSPSMLLSVDKPSPGAAAATVVLVAGAGDSVTMLAVVVAVPAVVGSAADVSDDVLLGGERSTVRVKGAGCVEVAEGLGRVQVVEVEVQSAEDWAATAIASGIGLVFCASARLVVVAPRAARMWEARI